ncbi:MAG TPA: dihydrolipoyl dehydrogenase [Candidatus Bathyarchaeia archaeon]|nr:dihydrolipoyl dehydrogenase [Candidatus Bathyarchaeia archaeon]
MAELKEYDLIAIGSGSALDVVNAFLHRNHDAKVAVIDKDEPGGICLTRGCIPSKMLMYPAEMVRMIEMASEFGIDVEVKRIDFGRVMDRMRGHIYPEIASIREGLSRTESVDYYPVVAEFVAPYTLKAGNEVMKSKLIILCTGSKPTIPPISGLDRVNYHTSDTILKISKLPGSIAIIGGGYIAAEYGHFFSAMGSKVTVVGRNPQFIPEEEPEISALARRELQKHLELVTNCEVQEVDGMSDGTKKIVGVDRQSGKKLEIIADELLIATGRSPNTDILHPEMAGIRTDEHGWIMVNDYMETSQPNIWAIGDADGKYPFKHVANYESLIAYYNAVLRKKVKVDYSAVPHAVFMYPEIASVGQREKEIIERLGEDRVLIGAQRYQDTAKGQAMAVKDFFVKVILEKETMKILGAHIIGPHASILIQEVINLMYTKDGSAAPIIYGMHIHPALSEVVQRAFTNLMPPEEYHHVLEERYEIRI